MNKADSTNSLLNNIKTEEVEEIIGTIPHWLLRYGISIILLAFLGLIILSNFIIYPVKIEIPTIISTVTKPHKINAGFDGRIKILKVNNLSTVLSGDTVAVIEGNANIDSLLLLKRTLSNINFHTRPLPSFNKINSLGDFNTDFLNIKQLYSIYVQKSTVMERFRKMESIENLYDQNRLKEAINGLIVKIQEYENSIFVTSKNTGIIYYAQDWSGDLEFQKGDVLFTVTDSNSIIVSRSKVPDYIVGEISNGQTVKIKIPKYPYQKYGYLIGNVTNVSKVPIKDFFQVQIDLPSGFVTNRNIKLDFYPETRAQAEIIIKREKLSNKIFNKINQLKNSN